MGTTSDQWVVVGGQSIKVTPETEVEGNLGEGLYVEAEVIVEPDGSFTAVELEVKGKRRSGLPNVEIEGAIEAMGDSTWTVAGYTIHLTGEATWQVGGETVTAATNADIEGDPHIGQMAEVKGLLAPDGTLLALEIEVEDYGEADVDTEDHAHIELVGVIAGLSHAQGDITTLSEEDLGGQDWPGDVTVTLADGTSFIVNQDTDIEGSLRNEVEVEVKLETAADGTRYATEIEVEDEEEAENLTDTQEDLGQEPEGLAEKEELEEDDSGSTQSDSHDNEESSGSNSHPEGPGTATEERDELRYEGTLVSFLDGKLLLSVDGVETSFLVNDETEVDDSLDQGAEVRVEAIRSDRHLIALKIKVR